MIGAGGYLTTQQISAESVAQRQWITALSIAGAEPAFEVNAPHVIRRHDLGKRLFVRRCAAAPPPRVRQTFLAQPFANRARGGQILQPTELREFDTQLLGSPARIALAQGQHLLNQVTRSRTTMLQRRTSSILQSVDSLGSEAIAPLVASGSADPVSLAKLAHHAIFRDRLKHKPHPLLHGTGLFPRHRQVLPAEHRNLSTMQSVYSVHDLIGPDLRAPTSPQGGRCRGAVSARQPNSSNTPTPTSTCRPGSGTASSGPSRGGARLRTSARPRRRNHPAPSASRAPWRACRG